jgi:uncharacterized Fe-S cluster protein YjdI
LPLYGVVRMRQTRRVGVEVSDEEQIMHEHKNAQIIVRYDASICTHAGNCVKGLPAVFDVNRDPWINLTAADPSAIIKTIAMCPSGALTYELVGEPSRT